MLHRFWGFIFNCAQLLTKQITVLFKPQGHKWNEHFQIEQGYILVGLTHLPCNKLRAKSLNLLKQVDLRLSLVSFN